MSVLIVGGDHLGSIPRELNKLGVTRLIHLSGRDQSGFRNGLPESMDLIIVLYDYASHNLTQRVKDLARSKSIPILFARRSWSSIYQKLNLVGLR
ncbi:MAG TPA: DUF2325 domain-containing protein [Candidatus Hypogeohydataceae bacterium YC41]